MFNFFKKKQEPNNHTCRYYLPQGVRVYAVGDIHGRADLLKRLHRRIIADAEQRSNVKNMVVYLGDYVDRGIEIREVLDTLVNGLPDNFQTIYLRGNHEETLLCFLEDPSLLEFWLAIGGQETLMNYRVAFPVNGFGENRAREVQKALMDIMPEKHLLFLRRLKNSFAIGDYFFTHAGVRPGVALSQQKPEDLLWIRYPFMSSTDHFGARVVHGHCIVRSPEILPNRIGLDTGAYATGILSCAVLEEDRVRLL